MLRSGVGAVGSGGSADRKVRRLDRAEGLPGSGRLPRLRRRTGATAAGARAGLREQGMRGTRVLAVTFAAWACAVGALGVVLALTLPKPGERATTWMGFSLFVVWVVAGGAAQVRWRAPLSRLLSRVRMPWRLRFVALATAFALIEEAVTTTLTNLAPLFGAPVGCGFITASANYLDVVLGHSVIVFVPMFVVWAWMLGRWAFQPLDVLVLFGVTGWLAEVGTFGPQNLGMGGYWVCVYGLMVYVPARALPERPVGLPRVTWARSLAAVFLPFALVPVTAGPVSVLHPYRHHWAYPAPPGCIERPPQRGDADVPPLRPPASEASR